MFIFYNFLFEMPREALFIMLCYVIKVANSQITHQRYFKTF